MPSTRQRRGSSATVSPLRASVRVRHTKWEEPLCTVYPGQNGTVRLVCDTPVRAPAAGQSAVLYDGERVLGGGFITIPSCPEAGAVIY